MIVNQPVRIYGETACWPPGEVETLAGRKE